MTESDLENLCLSWFKQTNWDVLYGPDIAPESTFPLRKNHRDVLLLPHLEAAFPKINPHIPASCFEQVVERITRFENLDAVSKNKAFHKLVLDGVPVSFKKDDQWIHERAFLIDFTHTYYNRFAVVNQISILGENQHVRRPDLLCFINGIPLAVLELKNPADENTDVWSAFNQLQTYKDDISDLFIYNTALVVSDGVTARIGSLTADKERFLPWKTILDEDDKPRLEWQLEVLVKGFFKPELLLDFLRHFILFETDGSRTIKKIAGYHQFHAVREAVEATLVASQTEKVLMVNEPRATHRQSVTPGSRKGGVVWHTQGSGKSVTMVCYAGKLLQQPEMRNPTIVVVTDRNDLDGQLFGTFSSAHDLLRQTPLQAYDRDDLRKRLSERESGGIIFTTVQKFALLDDEANHPVLNKRSNVVVISDEAHRSQYGLKATLTKAGGFKYGYARHLRDALPNATFIGFTGTPLSLEDKDTQAVFGTYVSVYDIQDAVDDGATVPIYYESRLARLDINRNEIDSLSEKVEEVIEDEEDVASREQTKGEWSRLEKLVGAKPRLAQIASDLVQHYETRTAVLDGKAMIVAMSRDICVQLYNEIIALRPDWYHPDPEKGQIKVVMTGSAADVAALQPHIYNSTEKKRLERRFKDPEDGFKVVIVRDMWLTGFDAPCCHTMYIDKPMRGHNLMQAIARVNRVFKNKPGGLVVDYIGVANELKAALKVYTESKGRGEPASRAEEAFGILLEKMDVVRGMFARTGGAVGFNYSAFSTEALNLILPAANYILSLKDGKKRFLDAVLSLTKAYSLCSTLEEARSLHKEIAFLSAVKAVITKFSSVDKKRTQEDKNSALKQILDNAVIAEGVSDVFKMAGLDKPNIGLLDEAFLEDVRRMPYRNLAVELLEKLINDALKAKSRNNVVQEKRFGDRLAETLRKYNNRAIETAQVIEELIQMARDFQEALEREELLGLNPDEVAFYDALTNNESAVRELGDEILKKIAVELTESLRKSTTIDWQKRESVRARLRILVRRTLQKYKYPPDKQAEAIELVLRQAEVLSNTWSG